MVSPLGGGRRGTLDDAPRGGVGPEGRQGRNQREVGPEGQHVRTQSIKDQGSRMEDMIEDRGQVSGIKDQGSRIQDQGSRIKDQGSRREVGPKGRTLRIKEQGSRIKNQGSRALFWHETSSGSSNFDINRCNMEQCSRRFRFLRSHG